MGIAHGGEPWYVLDTGSIKRPDGTRGSVFQDGGGWIVWWVWFTRGFGGESVNEARGPTCACDVVAHVALVARFFFRGLVFDAWDASFSFYETGWYGWFACVCRA